MQTKADAIRQRNRAVRARAIKSAALVEDYQAPPNETGTFDDPLAVMEARIAQKQQKQKYIQRLADLGHLLETEAEYREWVQLCRQMGCTPRQAGYNLSRAAWQFAGVDPLFGV
jgi:hypothetical protein